MPEKPIFHLFVFQANIYHERENSVSLNVVISSYFCRFKIIIESHENSKYILCMAALEAWYFDSLGCGGAIQKVMTSSAKWPEGVMILLGMFPQTTLRGFLDLVRISQNCMT